MVNWYFNSHTFPWKVSKTQEQQMKAAALARELDLLKTNNKQLKGQVQQLQELLATREQQHK